jgi:hypothetical protein
VTSSSAGTCQLEKVCGTRAIPCRGCCCHKTPNSSRRTSKNGEHEQTAARCAVNKKSSPLRMCSFVELMAAVRPRNGIPVAFVTVLSLLSPDWKQGWKALHKFLDFSSTKNSCWHPTQTVTCSVSKASTRCRVVFRVCSDPEWVTVRASHLWLWQRFVSMNSCQENDHLYTVIVIWCHPSLFSCWAHHCMPRENSLALHCFGLEMAFQSLLWLFFRFLVKTERNYISSRNKRVTMSFGLRSIVWCSCI